LLALYFLSVNLHSAAKQSDPFFLVASDQKGPPPRDTDMGYGYADTDMSIW
jgi:hypothetical protein